MLKKIIVATSAIALLTAPAYAEEEEPFKDVGLIGVREPRSEPPKEEEEDPNQFGLVRIPGGVVTPKPPTPTEEGEKIGSFLEKATKPHEEHDYGTALEVIESVRQAHPELPMLWSWRAAYLCLLGRYEESLDAWKEREAMFPFEPSGIEQEYFRADAYLGLGETASAKNEIQKGRDRLKNGETKLFSMDAPSQAENALQFLSLKIERSAEDVENLWNSIPKEERGTLGNYYGLNLSELWFWYGEEFGRKDYIEKFINIERRSENEKTIKTVREALREARR